MAEMGRCGGYTQISSYAVPGDSRTVTLVARDGAARALAASRGLPVPRQPAGGTP